MTTSLTGKVAIVTGAGRGIGRTHALLLAARGARVIVNDLGGSWKGEGTDDGPASQVVAEIQAAGGTAQVNHENVATSVGADALVQQALDSFGRLDILVNNAGILRDRMVVNMTDEDWDSVIAVHLRGHFAPTRAACRHWRAVGKATGESVCGRVICTSSESGLYGNAGQTNYSAAKAGIISFGVAVAREMTKYGVTCNVIAPRARTRMMENTYGEIPVGEIDHWDPANVSAVVGYLCSDDAAHINGQIFVVGGGALQLIGGFGPVWEAEAGARLDPDSVEEQLAKAFAACSSEPQPMPDLGLSGPSA